MNNTTHNIPGTIEAILFATAESYTVASLARLLNASAEAVQEGLDALDASLAERAFMLVRQGDEVTLATRPAYGELLEVLRKEELQKDLSKASAETLAVIAYHPGASKAEIELIRGVNSSYSLRALQIRGLIESTLSGRSATYHPTLALLESYGIATVEDLPQYQETKLKLESLL